MPIAERVPGYHAEGLAYLPYREWPPESFGRVLPVRPFEQEYRWNNPGV